MRTIAWLAGCRRLRMRYDRGSERFFAFVLLAGARLGYNRLPGTAEAHARSPSSEVPEYPLTKPFTSKLTLR